MEGPPAILDKSAFQALSFAELAEFRRYFLENVPPVLILEIMGDLKKQFKDGTVPEEKVAELASKFGIGEWLNEDWSFICVNTLLGVAVPLTGQVVPAYMNVFDTDNGPTALVEEGPLNHLIHRLAKRAATTTDHERAEGWRTTARSLNLSRLNEFVNWHHIIVPQVRTPTEAARAALGLIDAAILQEVWLAWLLELLGVNAPTKAQIFARWRVKGLLLRTFAPYAHYCLHALVTLFVAWRHNVIGWKSTNVIDLEYLYYLPFCTVFVSDDRLHRALAPALMRSDQAFVQMTDLKAGLRHTLRCAKEPIEGGGLGRRSGAHRWPPAGVIRDLWERNERWVGPPPPE